MHKLKWVKIKKYLYPKNLFFFIIIIFSIFLKRISVNLS
jgi:hypothetical protein